tara:strand:+ start:324 stop:668 length:345 start_codon:yes stop_codon:yes gene_type:complete
MAHTKINFNDQVTPNTSIESGDMAYICDVLAGGVTSQPILAGKVLYVDPSYIIIDKDPASSPVVTSGMFLLFSKRTEINDAGVKGYYADVTFENYSNKSIELYSISSEIVASSK